MRIDLLRRPVLHMRSYEALNVVHNLPSHLTEDQDRLGDTRNQSLWMMDPESMAWLHRDRFNYIYWVLGFKLEIFAKVLRAWIFMSSADGLEGAGHGWGIEILECQFA